MWCMLNSPLLAGNDLRHMSRQTIDILTNREIIALDQDEGFKQATHLFTQDSVEVWVKPLGKKGHRTKAIALMNCSGKSSSITLTAIQLSLMAKTNLRDLWLHKDIGQFGKSKTFVIAKHGIVLLKAF